MSYSPNAAEFEELFTTESICIDDDEVKSINPDEFLNLDEFKDIKTESPSSSCSIDYSPQLQLTPPISPQPNNQVNIESSSMYQGIRLIPIPALQSFQKQIIPMKKRIVPKPSTSSDSDSNLNSSNVLSQSKASPVDRALIRQQRLIRNREAASNSRRKQKDYVQSLETQNNELRKENILLKAENSQLKNRLKNYGILTCRCASSISRKLPSKNATMMLAVLLMFGVNIFPFGNFIFSSSIKKPIEAQPFKSRHLLFADNKTATLNERTSSESLEQKAPVYYNQTDQIRKVNIENIRRWIPEPDLFNASYSKDFDFGFDPLQAKLAKMYEKSREQSQKSAKHKRLPKKKQPAIGPSPMQLYNSNMNIIKLNEFFDEIDRKDDTFYVFSFKADHLLLPPDSSYNFSQIKMNLIMPRNNGERFI